MQSELREALDLVRADEALKRSTRQFVYGELEKRRGVRRGRTVRRALCAACACLALGLFAAGHHLYFTPTSVISMDINPSIELSVNRFDRIIDVSGYNEDGTQLAETLDLLHQDYEQAVEQVLGSETVQTCLAGDEFLAITVVEIDPQQGDDILQYIAGCTAGQANTRCYGVTPEDVEQAHSLGLSYGKYRAYLDVLAYTDQYSPQQIAAMTMRQIRELLHALSSGEAPSSAPTGGGGYGNGNGYGAGNGYGGGSGYGYGRGGAKNRGAAS